MIKPFIEYEVVVPNMLSFRIGFSFSPTDISVMENLWNWPDY